MRSARTIGFMPAGIRATLLVLGSVGELYCVGWALNYRGWTSRLLISLYRRWGTWLWPGGSQRTYVLVNQLRGWFGVIGFAYFPDSRREGLSFRQTVIRARSK